MRKKHKAPKQIKYWCAVGIVKQDAFREDGSVYQIDIEHPVGEQHIVYNGVLICRGARESIKSRLSAKKHKEVEKRIENVPMCKKCEKGYKANADLPWQKWVKLSEPVAAVEPFKLHGVQDGR